MGSKAGSMSQGEAREFTICVCNRPLPARIHFERASRFQTFAPNSSVLPQKLSNIHAIYQLRLVAQGLSDAQVAEQLVISRRTVNWHLTSIYSKLGVSSRCAATRSAMEHKLVERFLSLCPPLTCSRLMSSCASSRSREPHPVILPGCLRLSGCLTIQRQVMKQVILQMCHRPHPATL